MEEKEEEEEYLPTVEMSENSSPSLVAETELYYGRSEQHKLGSLWSNHLSLSLSSLVRSK